MAGSRAVLVRSEETQGLGVAGWCHAPAGSAALQQGLERLIEAYAQRLWRYFMRRGAGQEDSQDLVQEVFLRVIRERGRYRPELPLDGWVFAIARNLLLSGRRKRSAEGRLKEGYARSGRFAPALQGRPGAGLEQDEAFARMAWALAELAEEDQEVLRLSRLEGLDFDAIGLVLDCAPGTAKVRAFRALQRLRELFRPGAG